MRFAFQWYLLEYKVGDFDQGKPYLKPLMEAPLLPGSWVQGELTAVAFAIPLVARISQGISHFGVAESAAAQTILPSPPMFALMARAGLGLMAVLPGDGAAADEQYAAMERGTMFWGAISDDRLLGLLAHTMGNFDQAVAHFEDALTFCRKAGYKPELAWACCEYADTLLQRNNTGDPERANSLLRDSLGISSDLGMKPLMERVSSRLETMESASTSVPSYPDGLSQREVEVLGLIALAKSNREIAEELVIGLSTVAHHVSNVFNKAGASNRTEAATSATRHHMAPE